MGRALARRERHRRILYRHAPGPNVPHPREPLEEHPPKVALHRLRRLDRGRRPDGLRHPAVYHRCPRGTVWNHFVAAFVSVAFVCALMWRDADVCVECSIVSMMSTMIVIWAFVTGMRRVD